MKTIYTFGNGKAEGRADMRDLLGGKGANLAEMNLIGVPVPPGFTITTDVCKLYVSKGREAVVELIKDDVVKSIHHIESLTGNKFDDPDNPQLVSVLSGVLTASAVGPTSRLPSAVGVTKTPLPAAL